MEDEAKTKLTKPAIINSLPNEKSEDLSKLKAFADDKIDLTENLNWFLEEKKTLWEKEIVSSIFSFFNIVFKILHSQGR